MQNKNATVDNIGRKLLHLFKASIQRALLPLPGQTELDVVMEVYRLSQVFELLFEGVNLLVLVGQQHQQVVLLLLGLLHFRLQLRLLRLQDGHRAGG